MTKRGMRLKCDGLPPYEPEGLDGAYNGLTMHSWLRFVHCLYR